MNHGPGPALLEVIAQGLKIPCCGYVFSATWNLRFCLTLWENNETGNESP